MAREAGDRENDILSANLVSELGSEGPLSFISEVWELAEGENIPATDELESNVLRIPGGSKLLYLILSRTLASRMKLQYRDAAPMTAAGFGTWTDIAGAADGGTAVTSELSAPRDSDVFLTTLKQDRFIRVVPLAATGNAPSGGSKFKVLALFGNI